MAYQYLHTRPMLSQSAAGNSLSNTVADRYDPTRKSNRARLAKPRNRHQCAVVEVCGWYLFNGWQMSIYNYRIEHAVLLQFDDTDKPDKPISFQLRGYECLHYQAYLHMDCHFYGQQYDQIRCRARRYDGRWCNACLRVCLARRLAFRKSAYFENCKNRISISSKSAHKWGFQRKPTRTEQLYRQKRKSYIYT